LRLDRLFNDRIAFALRYPLLHGPAVFILRVIAEGHTNAPNCISPRFVIGTTIAEYIASHGTNARQ